MDEDRGAVLRADVGTLAVHLRRIVHLEEQLDELGVAHLRGIERHFHDLAMIGRAGADLAVVRIVGVAAFIARHRVDDARHLGEEMLDAPETPRPERGLFHAPSPVNFEARTLSAIARRAIASANFGTYGQFPRPATFDSLLADSKGRAQNGSGRHADRDG